MNLTWELRQGSIGRWCRRHLDGVDALDEVWQASVRGSQSRRPHHTGPGGPDWPRLGSAIHWRVTYGFASGPPLSALKGLALLDDTVTTAQLAEAFDAGCSPGLESPHGGPGDFALRLGRFVAGYDLAAPQPAKVERTLARAMWVLALWEDVYRAGPDRAGWWPADGSAAVWDGPAWLELAPDYAVDDVAGVAGLFTARGRAGLVAAAGSDDAIVEPVYVDGWAEADLKLESCLVDVKATVHPARLDPRWIWQLCCYAWLDGHVKTIAVHLVRQAVTVVLDLADTVAKISGGADPQVLAGRAREVMAEAAASVGKPIP